MLRVVQGSSFSFVYISLHYIYDLLPAFHCSLHKLRLWILYHQTLLDGVMMLFEATRKFHLGYLGWSSQRSGPWYLIYGCFHSFASWISKLIHPRWEKKLRGQPKWIYFSLHSTSMNPGQYYQRFFFNCFAVESSKIKFKKQW